VKAALGIIGLAVGALCALFGIICFAVGLATGNRRLFVQGRRLAIGVFVGALIAVGAMEWALLTHDFSLRYVADNNARATPLLFTISGLWAALEGSILLWILILGAYIAFAAHKFRDRVNDPLVAWALLTTLVVALFFLCLTLGPANPFKVISGVIPKDGQGPNPLLQDHVLMAFHPPLLYAGYVGFTIPFAFAVAALATGRLGEGWLLETRRATLVAWGFLTIGIILGAWWSYEVLGWGGYWAWDPVENASLLPWLTATAFIHSVIVQERRGMLRVWNLTLVIATFALTILGTFLTRSGVINSVHAFTESGIGPALLVFFGVVVFVGVGLIAWRGDQLRAPGRIDSALSREAAFLGNNLLFAAAAFIVLLGTAFPLLAEAIQGKQVSVAGPYFNGMTGPVGIVLLLLMAIAPALPWRAATGEVLRHRLLIPAWCGVAAMILTLLLGARGWAVVFTYGLAGFALSNITRSVIIGLRGRRRGHRENAPIAFVRMVRANPRLYGGLLVHAGVVCIAVAIVASSAGVVKGELHLTPGQTGVVDGYSFTNVGVHTVAAPQKTTTWVSLRVHDGGDDLGIWSPSVSSFPNSTEGIGTPAVDTGILRDIYITIDQTKDDSGNSVIEVAINPMIIWLWIGGGLMGLGTIVAISPQFRRKRPGARSSSDRAADAVLDDGPVLVGDGAAS
jgi:cytochrome c-type biogenesis protein CcmF